MWRKAGEPGRRRVVGHHPGAGGDGARIVAERFAKLGKAGMLDYGDMGPAEVQKARFTKSKAGI